MWVSQEAFLSKHRYADRQIGFCISLIAMKALTLQVTEREVDFGDCIHHFVDYSPIVLVILDEFSRVLGRVPSQFSYNFRSDFEKVSFLFKSRCCQVLASHQKFSNAEVKH